MTIVLAFALLLLVGELIVILVAAAQITPGKPEPGHNPDVRLAPIQRGPGGETNRPPGMIGDPSRVVDPGHNRARPTPVLTAEAGAVRRIDDRRMSFMIDLRCHPGFAVRTLSIAVALPDGVMAVEAVEFRGPPAAWTVTGSLLQLRLDEPRAVYIGPAGGWSADITVQLGSDAQLPDAAALDVGVTLSDASPQSVELRAARLKVAIPPVGAPRTPGENTNEEE
ncbi:MAG: hypothetical protein AB7K09_07315 [Planctomycetota bacterium]